MTWRLARSLETLRAQINRIAPNRSKVSDGTIGDAKHASRSSDHNPWVKDGGVGVVTALDITHDPKGGVDIQKLADALVASRDGRIKYIICNGRIVSGSGQKHAAWQWRPYSGSNKHNRHVHVSVKASKSAYDSTAAWKLDGEAIAEVSPADSVLRKGSRGPFVLELQLNLIALGFGPRQADGEFGDRTEAAVKRFQRSAGLKDDGWAGPRTLEAIGKALGERAARPKIVAAQEDAKDAAQEEVEKKTGFWQKLTGALGFGGTAGGFLWGMEWQTLAVLAGATILILLLILILRRQIVGAVKEIREGLA